MSMYDAGQMPSLSQPDPMETAKRSLYAPNDPQQQQNLNPWAHMPYSYESGGAPQGGQDQQPRYPQAVAPNVVFGPAGSEDDGGAANAANARALGQGVLAASQAATSGGMMGMGKKKKQQPDQQGADPYENTNQGQGWNVGGMGGISGT